MSNLHVGGGVQVGSSFLSEIFDNGVKLENVSCVFSDEVVGKNRDIIEKFGAFEKIILKNTYGIKLIFQKTSNFLKNFDTIFTIYGPHYRWYTPYKNIVGFAQAWIIYPDNEVYLSLPILERLKLRFKFWIQAQFFKRADILVVELDHVKQGLIRELGIDAHRIHVVHNCASQIYRSEEGWEPVSMPVADGKLKLGFLGRNYIHKNTAIFPAVIDALRQSHGIDALFYVTFTDEEWAACTSAFRSACINVGPLSAAQCPLFYKALDAVVFPSLLECFSATPLEALSMGIPLFASDRPFNHDICGDHAVYFDPLNPQDAASNIAALFNGDGPDPAQIERAKQHALSFSTPAERAQKYLSLLMDSTI
jgi:glycosyltransferase involved in cell wall biosynthesis